MEISMTSSSVELKPSRPDQMVDTGLKARLESSQAQSPVEVNATDAAQKSERFSVENTAFMESLNTQMASLNMGVAFSIDESTRSSVVKVIDRSTSEVIKQYPNDEALKVMQNIQAFLDSATAKQMNEGSSLTGALFNEII
jgi:flagellar protein FlaG